MLILMKGKIKFFMFIIILLFVSCQSKQDANKVNDIVQLSESHKLVLPIDENTYYMSRSIFQYEEDGKEFLHFENNRNNYNEIVIFDIEEQEVSKKVKIDPEGPNGVPAALGCRPLNNSSKEFIVFQNNVGRVSLINDKGEVLRKYETTTSEGRFNGISLFSYMYLPTFVKDSSLYIAQELWEGNIKKEDWSKIPMFFSIDLVTNSIEQASLMRPDIFEDCIAPMGGYEFTYDYNYKNNLVVCSFIEYDSIMVSKDLKHATWYNAKSRYVESMRPELIESNEGAKAVRGYKERAMYSHIMYDKYRDVYYRFVELPCELARNETPYSPGVPKAREFSVIVMDKNFDIIGETKFPGNTYFYKMSFVGKSGLYISENNLNNPAFDENKLIFACFTLEERNKLK